MSRLFEQGDFRMYSRVRLDEAMSPIYESAQYFTRETTVFISHKHDELEELKGVLGFLQAKYHVKVYIDSVDPSMPQITSKRTAENLKSRIWKCDKFILLATNGAIESKWCNWELGFGDAKKYKEHIALLPMKPKDSSDLLYKGAEYLQLYPYIRYSDGTEKYSNGDSIIEGYYVVSPEEGKEIYISLDEWFKSR